MSSLGHARGAWIATVSIGAALLVAPVAAQPMESTGLVGVCSVCHGTDLKGSGAVPLLRGHDAEYIKEALTEFRAGRRPATVMTQLMRGFSDSDIEALAQQIGAMK